MKEHAHQAAEQNKKGLEHYGRWEIDQAITAFEEAITADPQNPEYHLNLARAHARSSNYHQAMAALGDYLRTETDDHLTTRYERLFASGLDEVETPLIETMRELDMTIQQIGKAIQMWLEYRIAVGRQMLNVEQPKLWAAALTYAVAKVNLLEMKRSQIAQVYDVDQDELRDHYRNIVETLDLMPADYRYFAGEDNPLDKLVEAAQMLEELDRRFAADD